MDQEEARRILMYFMRSWRYYGGKDSVYRFLHALHEEPPDEDELPPAMLEALMALVEEEEGE